MRIIALLLCGAMFLSPLTIAPAAAQEMTNQDALKAFTLPPLIDAWDLVNSGNDGQVTHTASGLLTRTRPEDSPNPRALSIDGMKNDEIFKMLLQSKGLDSAKFTPVLMWWEGTAQLGTIGLLYLPTEFLPKFEKEPVEECLVPAPTG